MAENEKRRLYKRIVQAVDQRTLLERMRLYGFWPADREIPPDPPDEAAERAELEAEIARLRQQAIGKAGTGIDPQKALTEERKRRWEASTERRARTRAKRETDRALQRAAWEAKRQVELVHLGQGVSAGLQATTCEPERLAAAGVPVLRTGKDLAELLEISLGTLRWLTYHRQATALVHYHRYEVPKKSGGYRCISAPKPQLAAAQRVVLERILAPLTAEPEAHGFVPGRSILSNAREHCGSAVVVNMDLKDFFPSIDFRRVKGLFRVIGYSEQAATVLGLLCTEPPRVAAEWGGRVYFVALGERVLPQGAATSPAITNLICRRLDRRLAGLAGRHGFVYTRYADDLTFSSADRRKLPRLLRSVRTILGQEGFRENERKTRIMGRGGRQEVTGILVNEKPSLAREELRRLRAILHNAAHHGLESQNREGHPDFAAYLRGRVAYAAMAAPHRAAALRSALAAALARP